MPNLEEALLKATLKVSASESYTIELEAGKAADVLLLVIPAEGGLDALGEQLVGALGMQGVGSVVGVVEGVTILAAARRGAGRKG